MLPVPLSSHCGAGNQQSCDQGYETAYDDQSDHEPDYYLIGRMYAIRI